MDLGIKIFYLVSLQPEHKASTSILHNIHHELSKTSPLFYYLETAGISFNDTIIKMQDGSYFKKII